MRQFVWSVGELPGRAARPWRSPERMAALLLALLLVLPAAPGWAQGGSVGGVVVAEQSQRPLGGVQVVVEGTGRGTLTDERGRFLITGLSGGEVMLRVILIGHRNVTRSVRVGDTDVRIALAETAIELDRVVVTGTTAGTERRRQIGNSVATVDAAQLVEIAPVQTMQQMLTGRAAGVFVAPATGMVGSGQRIRIRGQTTFSLSGDPLIYIDGVRVNNEVATGISNQGFGSGVVSRLNDINPDEIESIEIIKGPAAATLYGTEAARGVINIITKKGAAGGTRFDFTVRQGASWFANPEGRLPTNYWTDPTGNVQSLDLFAREKAAGRDIFRTGHLQGYNLSMNGGTEQLRYFVSGDFARDEGIDPTNDRDQFSGRANMEITPSEKFNLSVSTGYINNDTQLACEAGCGGRMWGLLFASPLLLPENCAVNAPTGCGWSRGFRSWPTEPYDIWTVTQQIHRFTGSATANWTPLSWMTHRFTLGRDVTNEENRELLPFLTNDTLRYFWGPRFSDGYRYERIREVVFDTWDYSGNVEFAVRPGLSSSTSLGAQYYVKSFDWRDVQGEGFPAPGVNTVEAAANKTFQTQDYYDNKTLGFYAQQVFGFNDRLFLTGAVRVDNNSAFGADVDFVTYPKASLSWVLSEEPFFQQVQPAFLSTFRFRTAFGESGQQPEIFSALRTFRPVTGPGGTSAVTPQAVGNPSLKPERGREIEVGFDAGFLNDRLGLDFTYYRTQTKDAILSRGVPPSTGFGASTQWVNAGEILNQGIEAQIRAQVLNRRNFGWDLNFNLATNDSEVRRLTGEDTTIVVGSVQHRIGYPAWAWFRERVVSAEFNPATGRTTNVMCDNGQGGATPCFNAAGQVIAPRVYLGRNTPATEGSITSTFSFLEHFRLYGMMDFKRGFKKWDNNLRARCQIFNQCLENVYPEQADPRVLAQMQTTGTLVDFVINDASFTRLREVALDVGLPNSWTRAFGGRRTSINFAARNLYTWTDYTGLDPEAMFLGGSITFQLEQDQIPHPAQFVTTINVSF
ncbi:TonB-dependent receptor [soil metagenome]|nr:SusC/RagA family TonB-linked outer membrane protein [Acidobacteriota bacterium]